ncbi:hypothetical protein M3Y97_00081500 [Aphelenchoides bicaudatus]|nr:hypothetical protein M3Y97_00081500 [Aphelenchoides bicaudatus]
MYECLRSDIGRVSIFGPNMSLIGASPETLPNSLLLLQLMRANQGPQSLLINTLVTNQQRVFSSFLQQQQTDMNFGSLLENNSVYNLNFQNLEFQLNLQNLLNNTATQQNLMPTISNNQLMLPKINQSTSAPVQPIQKTPLEESMERKRLIRAKLLSGRPRANTNPITAFQPRKMRPKTNSFTMPSNKKQCASNRHHPANLPIRNQEACVLEELGAFYLLNSLASVNQQPADDNSDEEKSLPFHVNVHEILDKILESQL